MLSQTGLYALQALLRLASERSGEPVAAGAMASELGIPANYLSKVLQRLAHEGIVTATRGARGGYRLVADPDRLSVATAVAPFQDLKTSRTCLMGGICDPASPCPAHERRLQWSAAGLASLERTMLADLLNGSRPSEREPEPTTLLTESDR